MNSKVETTRLRGKLMLTGTLAMFALGTVQSEAAAPVSKDETKPVKPDSREDSSSAEDQGRAVHHFDIPASTVGEVVDAIQKQSGLRISLQSVSKMAGIASPGVRGVITVQEALEQALANTGLSARFDKSDSVIVEMRANNESVVVTADNAPSLIKYTAPLVDLPQTITVIGQDTIGYTASSTLVEALRTVPGITFGAGEGGNPLGDRPFIRGIDSQASTYIDGIRDIAAQSREVFDIDTIEVQEGPGGAYGGRGTGGGSINMNSKLARRDNFIAGSIMPGTSNYVRGTVDGNWKVSRLVSGRLVGMWHTEDVAGRDAVHNGRWGVAPSLAVGLGTPSRAYFDYYHLVTNNMPDAGIPYNNPTTVPTVDPGPRLYQAGDGSPLTVPNRRIFYGLTDRDHNRSVAKVATGRLEHDLWHEHSLIRNSFRYERTSQDYIWTQPDDSKGNIYYGLLFRRINNRVSAVFTLDNQTDLSGSFHTGSVKHNYATGMEFSKERGNNDTNTAANYLNSTGGAEFCPTGAGITSGYNCVSLFAPDYHDPWTSVANNKIALSHNPTHSSSATRSAYVFDTIVFSKHFQSTVGARYDHYDSIFTPAKSATAIAPQEVINNLGTYIGSLIYKPDQATSVYGSVSTAAIPSGNSLAQGVDTSALSTANNNLLQPQKIRQEEFGAKREFAGGKSMARIDFFRTDIQNVRITQADGSISASGNNRTLGMQVGLSGQVTKKIQVTGGYTYLDAILVNAGGTGANNGQSMPNTARHSVSVTGNYSLTRRLRAGGGIYTMTKVWGSQSSNKWVPGYARVDLFGNYEINRHFNVQANIQNVGNKLYYNQAYPTHYASMAPGRSAVFGLNVKF